MFTARYADSSYITHTFLLSVVKCVPIYIGLLPQFATRTTTVLLLLFYRYSISSSLKKKMVALIILIIALQFDVSTSCNDSLR